ncbi:MAG: hypothetical protein HY535_09290 [Chloroflexi bacterium]|nr:hypothetical protein [Chloroflexota bacterium]
MWDVLAWLLAAEFLGLLAFPILFALTPGLPDRGFSLTKPFGLLLAFYPLWLLGSSRVIPSGTITLVAILAILLAVSAFLAWFLWDELQGYVRRQWRMLVLTEVVFLGLFAVWAVIKARDPGINHTEQPMDFAFLNAALVSRHFPPEDPWLAGQSVSYYYFGYLIFGGIIRLTGVASSVGYTLALVLVAAMAGTGVFGLVANLVRLRGGKLVGAALAGAGAVVLLMGIANLESALELARASGLGSAEFWKWVGIKDLGEPLKSPYWYPGEPGWWWWRATRVIDTVEAGRSLDYTITEFPFFSLVLGDLHPHVMSLPFVALFLGLVLNLWTAPEEVRLQALGGRKLVPLAFVLGALGFINAWDLPTFTAVLGVTTLAKAYPQSATQRRVLVRAMGVAGAVLVLALFLYLPFYASFRTQATGVLPVEEYVTRPFHFVVLWGLFLGVVAPYLAWRLVAVLRRRLWGWREVAVALGVALAPLAAWGLVEGLLVFDVAQAAGRIGGRVVHLLPLVLAAGGAAFVVLGRVPRAQKAAAPAGGTTGWLLAEMGLRRAAGNPTQSAEQRDLAWEGFPMLLVLVAFLLFIGVELFFVVDLFLSRMNIMFKLYYQAWVLLAVAGSYAVYSLSTRFSGSAPVLRLAWYGWVAVVVVGVAAALYYPAAMVYTKTDGSATGRTLDGLAFLERDRPEELAAIRWLQDHYQAGDRLVEAVGDDYSEYGRVSASTGIPTVVGWIGHEAQWRGSTGPFEGRAEAVQRIYQTQEAEEARGLLQRYGVRYVVVGPREQAKYGTGGLEKFKALGVPVFEQGKMVVYRVGA